VRFLGHAVFPVLERVPYPPGTPNDPLGEPGPLWPHGPLGDFCLEGPPFLGNLGGPQVVAGPLGTGVEFPLKVGQFPKWNPGKAKYPRFLTPVTQWTHRAQWPLGSNGPKGAPLTLAGLPLWGNLCLALANPSFGK